MKEMNTSIFDFIGFDGDPLYAQLQLVSEEQPVQIDGFTVTKAKYYEVSNDDVHLGFNDLESCYQFLSHAVVTGVVEGEQS